MLGQHQGFSLIGFDLNESVLVHRMKLRKRLFSRYFSESRYKILLG